MLRGEGGLLPQQEASPGSSSGLEGIERSHTSCRGMHQAADLDAWRLGEAASMRSTGRDPFSCGHGGLPQQQLVAALSSRKVVAGAAME